MSYSLPPLRPPANASLDANIPKVIEYLTKKGYVKTEQTLRRESSHVDKDGRPVLDRVEDLGNEKYQKAFTLLSNWIEGGLDVYKVNSPSRVILHTSLTLCSSSCGDSCGRSSFILSSS